MMVLILVPLIWTTSIAKAEPSTHPTTPAVAPARTPSEDVHRLFQALDTGNRKSAVGCWNVADPKESQITELQVDMMLAIAKLKKAVRAKWGVAATFDLEMAVVGEDECGPIKEQITGDVATVVVASVDQQQAPRDYSLVKTDFGWKLSVADQLKNRPTNISFEQELEGGKALIKTISDIADAVSTGQLQSTDDVKRKLSESMGSP